MKSARHLVGRSVAWLVIGIAVFVGVLGTLPVPQVAEGPAERVHQENFAITDVTVFDGETFRHGWDVWVEDGRIRHAGQRLDLPEELPRLDGRGHTLIPGLVDGHVHTFGSTLNDALRFGVTTVMDQFTPPAFVATKRGAREEVGPGTEADLFSAGMAATAPGGHGTQYGVPVETLTGPDEAAALGEGAQCRGLRLDQDHLRGRRRIRPGDRLARRGDRRRAGGGRARRGTRRRGAREHARTGS